MFVRGVQTVNTHLQHSEIGTSAWEHLARAPNPSVGVRENLEEVDQPRQELRMDMHLSVEGGGHGGAGHRLRKPQAMRPEISKNIHAVMIYTLKLGS